MIAVIKSLWSRIQAWRTWETDPAKAWYYNGPWTERWFGNLRFHRAVAIIYTLVSVILPVAVLCAATNPIDFLLGWLAHNPVKAVLWLAFVTLALPLFIWHEQLAFDNWIATITDTPTREKITSRFNINAKHMETFWKTVATLYLTAGLFSFATEKNKPANPPTQKDIEALTHAFNYLTQVVAGKGPVAEPGHAEGAGDSQHKREERSTEPQKSIESKGSEPPKNDGAKPPTPVLQNP